MNLATAKAYCEKIYGWLLPYAEPVTTGPTLQAAGSIRRERPICNDVDLVMIPKVEETRDLLGMVASRRNLALEMLQRYVANSGGKARFISGGEKEGKQCIVELPKCQLDLWFATPANIGTRLLCRTGSKEHNILLASRAQDLGGSWNPYEGVTMNGVLLPATTEQEVYEALKLPWIEPRDREGEFVARVIRAAKPATCNLQPATPQ